MTKLKALLFDVDGTLAETERDGHRVAFNKAFAEKGLQWHWDVELYGELLKITGGKERIRHFVKQYRQGESIDDALVNELHSIKTGYFVEAVATGEMPLRPGVKRLLADAREAGFIIAIATTTTIENVTALLETHLGTEGPKWFDVIGAGDVVAKKKPAPDIYHYVLDKLQLEPGQCIAFEDSRNGLLSSKGAGVATLITPSFYTRHENFDSAALVVSDLGEPDKPFEVIAGDACGEQWVNTMLLQKLNARV